MSFDPYARGRELARLHRAERESMRSIHRAETAAHIAACIAWPALLAFIVWAASAAR